MDDRSGRPSGLDLDDAALQRLLGDAAALAKDEVTATQTGPVFAETPTAAIVREGLATDAPLPREGIGHQALTTAADAFMLGRRSSPAFFGYVFSPPAAPGVAGDLLASAADQNVTSWRSAPAATAIERQTLKWVSTFIGYADQPGGIFLSGGSLANLTALLIALRSRAPSDVDRRTLCVYSSAESHFSVRKAAAAIGVSARRVPTDDAFRLDVGALEAAIEHDRADGLVPFCVVGNAGTTATGAVDDLARIADVAQRAELWFHVDGAYGAPAAATDVAAREFAGLDRADSVAVDAHKWLYVPVDCGVLLVRDPAQSYGAFGPASDYVRVLADADDEAFAFWDHGLELSRRSRALKLWLTFRYYGADRLAQAVGEDIRLAGLMGDIVRAAEDFELLCEPSLSICCFRHRPPGMSEDELDGHNEALLARLQRDGRAYFSNVSVAGRFGLRACITNFRTTEEDVRRALAVVEELSS